MITGSGIEGNAAVDAARDGGTTGAESVRPVTIVDCDVHVVPSPDEVREFMPDQFRGPWLDHLTMGLSGIYATPNPLAGMREDSVPTGGGAPGTDPALLEKQLFVDAGVDIAVLLPVGTPGTADPRHDAGLRAARNAWLAETWLGRYNQHGRFRGSICVSATDTDLAVAEIEKWAGHEGFVQVLLDPYLINPPLGDPRYRKLHDAAARHGLPIALHIARTPGMANLTPMGFGSYYSEIHPLYSFVYMPHLVSFIAEGVFDRYPDLTLVLVEGGVSWVGPVVDRLQGIYRTFPAELPRLQRPARDYLASNVRVTTQPIEEPARAADLHLYLDWMSAGETLMFSSDYPHWDFDDPSFVAARLPASIRSSVMYGNASRLYRLPDHIRVPSNESAR
ncbi:amidohydrolase family protein [Pseudonocardia sp. GCM10023141]|uniref:amidohydrolase family protein n=1 Tax=Pseudonocardia sp. GCM10023141 TaxID=3252653 RepID=UPI003623D59F